MSLSQNLIRQQMSIEEIDSSRVFKSGGKGNEKNSFQITQHIEQLIFEHTGCKYVRHQIKISQNQTIFSYFIEGKSSKDITFYISHGFGGSSLMFFPIFKSYLQKGNIVLWQLRGMGVGIKNQYEEISNSQINQFYEQGLSKILNYYNHNQIIFLCHSLSAYVVLRYIMKQPSDKRIAKAILLSPVGLTSKSRDDKNSIKSCSDILSSLINNFGWKFNLTFKSPLRTICCCLKKKLLKSSFSQFSLSQEELNIMVQLFLTLIQLPDGSQNIFFRYFEPRVLPREGESIEQLFQKGYTLNKNISIYYGGQQDWVDQKGANFLSHELKNVRLTNFRDGGHMFCLKAELMKQILQQQIQ